MPGWKGALQISKDAFLKNLKNLQRQSVGEHGCFKQNKAIGWRTEMQLDEGTRGHRGGEQVMVEDCAETCFASQIL